MFAETDVQSKAKAEVCTQNPHWTEYPLDGIPTGRNPHSSAQIAFTVYFDLALQRHYEDILHSQIKINDIEKIHRTYVLEIICNLIFQYSMRKYKGRGDGGSGMVWGAGLAVGGEASRENIGVYVIGRV